MKKLPLALMAMSVLGGACATQPLAKPARHVVSGGDHRLGGDPWLLSQAEIEALENDLGALWARPDGRMIGRTKRKLSDYVVRYRRAEVGGRRIIVGEAQHMSLGNAGAFLGEVGDSVVLKAFGGGDLGFEVRYDVEVKRVIEVRFGAAL
jgi:hypothetical protein